MKRLITPIISVIALVAMATPSPASATDRYASPTGSGTACTVDAPCTVAQATTGLTNDVNVYLEGGTYNVTNISINNNINLTAKNPLDKPRLVSTDSHGIFVAAPGAVVSDLIIDVSTWSHALYLYQGEAHRIVAINNGEGPACSLLDGSISDSLCYSATGNAVKTQLAGNADRVTSLTNVTAIAPLASAIYIRAMQGIDLTLNMTNTIAQGTTDVHVIADENDSTSATVQATNSNFSSTTVAGPAASIVDNEGNQTTEPTFVEPASDFHQMAESVTVDAGQAREPGALDNEYEARDQNGVDIGADELDDISPNITLNQGPSDGAMTNDSSPTWTFSSGDLTTDFACRFHYNEWGDWSPCGTGIPGQGSYTTNPAITSSNSDLALEVQGTDLSGWTDTKLYTYEYVDNTAPVIAVLSQPSAVMNEGQTAAFTFSTDDASANLECRLVTSGEGAPAWNDCSSGQFTSDALIIGDYTFEVKSTDQDLNTGTATDSFQVRDLVAPGTSFTRTPRRISYDRTPVFGFSSNDSKATFQCKMDANPWKVCASPRQYLPGAGWHTFKVRAVDPHQNVDATPASRRFKIERRRS